MSELRSRRRPRLVALFALGLALPIALAMSPSTARAPQASPAPSGPSSAVPVFDANAVRAITHAEFCRSDGDAPADAGCRWTPVTLAHVWRGSPDRPTSDGWFRLHFGLDTVPEQGVALYIVAFNRTGRLFVNAQYAGEFGAMTEPLPMNWNRSQYALLAPGLLHAGDNVIEVQQRIYQWEDGWLAPVRIGSAALLRPLHQRRVFWQNDLVRILGATTAAAGLIMLGVWLGRRAQAMYFWFGLSCLLWTAISLDYFALDVPLEAHAWENVVECAQVLRAVLMFVFVLRYCGRRERVLEAGLWAYFAFGTALVFAHRIWGATIDLWYFGTLLAAPYFFFLLVREGLRRSRVEGLLLGLAGLAQIVLSAYDLWLFSEHSWTDHVYLAHFSAPLLLFVVGWILVQHFIVSLNAYERLAGVLEQRVGAKAAELERNYEQLLEARRNEALALERSRIMSEMHDGIGSQLTLALSLVRNVDGAEGRVAVVLRESIEDLQLIIDSLEPVENDLLTVLGTLRYRLQDRLSQSGIELHWNVVDLPPLPVLTPHAVLSILRILQEAFANCLKHSGARRIVVSTGLGAATGIGETACIRIVDDGRGVGDARRGRGLDNMQRRADALGGRLTIASRPGRTEVLLEVPTLRHPR